MLKTPSKKTKANTSSASGKKSQSSLLNFFGTPNNKTPNGSSQTPTKAGSTASKTETPSKNTNGSKIKSSDANEKVKEESKSALPSSQKNEIAVPLSQESATTATSKNGIDKKVSLPPPSQSTELSQESDTSPGKRVCLCSFSCLFLFVLFLN